jgi:hypothetical protein
VDWEANLANSNQNDAAALEQEVGFQNLDGSLKKFIRAFVQGHEQLRTLVSDEFWATQALISAANEATRRQIEEESRETRKHVTATQAVTESRRDHEAQRKQLLESLYDKDMNARRNQIEKRHTVTFSWVFNEEIQRPWDSFTEWLSSKDSIYWICGKAGSGKSTLIKFLIDDERTSQYLYKWAPDCLIYSYFIWNSGTRIQRSILGLLRSLLYQIFEANEHILDHILRENPEISRIRNPKDWSRDDLEETLVQSLSLHQKGVCIFLDGLDEIDSRDGPFNLLVLVERISSLPNNKGLKVCASSRPEASFILGLKNYPKLRLQDLTKHDVEVYANDFLKTKCTFNLSGIDESQFLGEIVNKANGVFLWVSLALKSLQRGITNGDDPTKLMERLRALPSELGKLYEEMLRRLGDDQDLYSQESAMLFNIFIHFSENAALDWRFKPLNLFQYAVAFDPLLRDMLLKQKNPPSPKILKKFLLGVDRKLTSRCAGILEVISHLEGHADVDYILSRDTIRPWDPIGIGFLHRSAKDFLLSMKDKLLDQDPTSAAERKFRVIQAIVLDDSYPPEKYSPDQNAAMGIMINAEPTLSNEQELDILKLIQGIYQQNGWCEFYEVVARYGIHQPLARLLESSSGNTTSLRNYLLLCAVSDYTNRTNTTVSKLLKGGDYSNNCVALVPAVMKDDSLLFLPMPLLGYFFNIIHPRMYYNEALIKEILDSFLQVGPDLEQKFLCPIFGLSRRARTTTTHKTRPCYRGFRVNPKDFDLLVEINCIELILCQFVGSSHFNPVERLAMISRFGLDPARAHHKVLLYFYDETVYGAEDEDSDNLNKILGWSPQSRIDDKDKGYTKENANEKEKEAQFEKVREVLKGKEVDDVKKWLTDRGYELPEDSDMAAISDQASIHEMAGIYERISKNLSKGQ